MSASTLKPSKPRNRLQPLATALSWVFWLAVAVTALQVIVALSAAEPCSPPSRTPAPRSSA